MNGNCMYCGRPLTTGDFNGVCQECREMGRGELKEGTTWSSFDIDVTEPTPPDYKECYEQTMVENEKQAVIIDSLIAYVKELKRK